MLSRADSILIPEKQHPSSVRHGICQPSTSNDHKCAPGVTNSYTITDGLFQAVSFRLTQDQGKSLIGTDITDSICVDCAIKNIF